MSRLTLIALATVSLGLVAAPGIGAPAPSTKDNQATAPKLTGRAKRGYEFTQAHCTHCHGITANAISPNPESPPFDTIANRPGLSEVTFTRFLEDSHNYPEAMNFKVDHRRIKDIAAYMLTMRGEDYRPEI